MQETQKGSNIDGAAAVKATYIRDLQFFGIVNAGNAGLSLSDEVIVANVFI